MGRGAAGDLGQGADRARQQAPQPARRPRLDGANALTSAFGCYRLELPEGTLGRRHRGGEPRRRRRRRRSRQAISRQAKAAAALAASLVRQPFLPGEEGTWVEEKRRELADVRGRALSALADACLRSGDAPAAAKWAEQTIALAPFRETGYRRLMEAQSPPVTGPRRSRSTSSAERCWRRSSGPTRRRRPSRSISRSSKLARVAAPRSIARPDEPSSDRPLPTTGRASGTRAGASSRRSSSPRCSSPVSPRRPRPTSGDEAPPKVLPNSVVRLDPGTLEPTQVVRVGNAARPRRRRRRLRLGHAPPCCG